MDQLPVEIATKILALACFDDKTTGCSLRLTCKWLGEVVKPVRFEALSLCGLPQLTQFSMMLEHLPPHARTVKHLFVSGIGSKEAEERKRARDLEMRKRAVRHKLVSKTVDDDWDDEDCVDRVPLFDPDYIDYDYYRASAERKQKQTAFDKAFYKIIEQTASSIRTLFVTTTFGGSTGFPPFLMPNLTDLSVTSTYRAFTSVHPFPRLQRIHTDLSIPFRSHQDRSSDWRINTPALEELRVTGVGEQSWRFLDGVVNHARCMEAGEKDGLLFPDSMKRIMLQQEPPPYGAICGNSYIQHGSLTGYLHKAANCLAESEDRRVGFRLVVLEMLDISLWLKGKTSGLCYSYDDAKRDWLDVISGSGRGCWNDS